MDFNDDGTIKDEDIDLNAPLDLDDDLLDDDGIPLDLDEDGMPIKDEDEDDEEYSDRREFR